MILANTAKWAKARGTSKLNYILVFGVIFGVFVTVLTIAVLFLLDTYLLHKVFLFDPFQIIGTLVGAIAAGFYSSAVRWEQLQKAAESDSGNG